MEINKNKIKIPVIASDIDGVTLFLSSPIDNVKAPLYKLQ